MQNGEKNSDGFSGRSSSNRPPKLDVTGVLGRGIGDCKW